MVANSGIQVLPQLCNVGRAVRNGGRQKLLVRAEPGDLLHVNPQPGMARLELGEQLRHHFPFAPGHPQLQLLIISLGPTGAEQREHGQTCRVRSRE